MRRRNFVMGFGGAAVTGALPAVAQQAKRLPVVGLVMTDSPLAAMTGPDPVVPTARAVVHGLRDLGWIEGRTIVIERRSAEGDRQRAPAIVADLLARGVDVIVLAGARWLQDAARSATRTIPIVTHFPDDPIASGLIASLARPGGNFTGISSATGPEFHNKRLQLLRDLAPGLARVAFLAPGPVLEQYRAIAPPAGMTIVPIPVDAAGQFEEAFATIRRERVDALMAGPGPVNYARSPGLAAFAAESRLPAIYGYRETVEAGGLMSYGTNINGVFRQLARLADKFLRGAKIGDIPTELPTKFELVINGKTAKALGLDIPPLLLAQADEVIE